MKRSLKLLAAVLGTAAAITGVAVAASSPTVLTRPARFIAQTGAVLRGAVNPNGNQTGYVFDYGLTPAYGLTTTSHSAGQGTKPRSVNAFVSGLLPGTIYHYRIAALNKNGAAYGGDRRFRTTGHPPASVITGPAVNVGKNDATPTGSINPQGKATTWSVVYGLSTAYTSQTLGQTQLAAVNAPLPVSAQITGLAPGKLYHYQIVAKNGPVSSAGGDQTFFTLPGFRRKPTMTTRTSPKHATRRPYVFTTGGTLHGANFVPSYLRCTGRVGIRYYNGRHQVAFVLVQVGSNCKFSTPVSFGHLINGGSTNLQVKIFFRGNPYLRQVEKTDHITLG
jgi:hypothetical protein